MGRISLSDIDNYGTSSNGAFFQLKDDGDKARVRFLYNDINDLMPYVVHEVQVGDKTKYVNCLRNYDEPMDKCPFCKAGYRPIPKLFLKMYNEDSEECQVWERGKTYAQRIANLAAHFNPLHDEIVEITRFGKKGDMQTRYEFMPIENSAVSLDDYDCAEPLGWLILDKTAEEMNEYLDLGDFPNAEVAQARSEQPPFDGAVTRRTPSGSNGGNTSRRAF